MIERRPGGDTAQPQVMTVTGPVDPATLGVTDAHDHLFLRSPALAGEELDDVDAAIEEVAEGAASGLQAIVELTPIGLGRRPDLLRRVSEATGVAILGATGYHRDAHYPAGHWVLEADETTLAERMIADIEEGMHPSDWDDPGLPPDTARAGVIKVGASYQHISRAEHRRLVAAAAACHQTGAPIVVHTEVGTCADEILDVLHNEGIAGYETVLAHMDRNPDPWLHEYLLDIRGVFVVYDTIGRIRYAPDSTRLDLIERMVAADYGGQIMLGMDLGRRDYFRAHGGGPGLQYLFRAFTWRLEDRIGAEATRRILVDNPAIAFAIEAPR